jgi:hypothetical protein
MKPVLIAALTAALMFGVAHAHQQPSDVSRIVSQQNQLRTDLMARSGRYKNVSANKRDELLSRQARMLATLDGKQTFADLTDTQKVEVFNTLEWIQATINNTEDERVVCRRGRTLGSQRVNQLCRTQAEWREYRDSARTTMERRPDGFRGDAE